MPKPILFTAFEPSGDAVAAALTAELKRRYADLQIYALGGDRIAGAGGHLIENTTEDPVMLAGAVRQMATHRRRLRRLAAWLAKHELSAVVPTDSPAANWSICRLVRRLQPQTKIIHLAAPQLWAWAPWRIGKLRRLTDLVLCLLPFETQWFCSRGVKATFVGHPIFETPLCPDTAFDPWCDQEEHSNRIKLAILPGSRSAEIKSNYPTMIATAMDLADKQDQKIYAAVAAMNETRRQQVESMTPPQSTLSLSITCSRTDQVLQWADVALVVSGTATLQVLRHRVPMVTMYHVNRWSWHLIGRFLIQTRTFTLPNLIGQSLGLKQVVPELVPHFGKIGPVRAALEPILTQKRLRQQQRAGFDEIAQVFAQKKFSEVAASALIDAL